MSQYLLFITRNGLVKKTHFSEYVNIRQSGLAAIKLEEQDLLLATHTTTGTDDVLLVSASGKSIRFSEKSIRPTGRATRGVKGITLKQGDYVIGADVIQASSQNSASNANIAGKQDYLLTITQNGYGKMSPLSQYRQQGRGGQGIYAHKINQKTGPVVDMKILSKGTDNTKAPQEDARIASEKAGNFGNANTDLLVVSTSGQTIRLPLSDIPVLGRNTQGVRIIRLNQKDSVAALATL